MLDTRYHVGRMPTNIGEGLASLGDATPFVATCKLCRTSHHYDRKVLPCLPDAGRAGTCSNVELSNYGTFHLAFGHRDHDS